MFHIVLSEIANVRLRFLKQVSFCGEKCIPLIVTNIDTLLLYKIIFLANDLDLLRFNFFNISRCYVYFKVLFILST